MPGEAMGSTAGSTSERNIVTLLWLCSQVLTLSNSSHSSSMFRRLRCGGFPQFLCRIGCMSLFKYCKGFLLKSNKKHSNSHHLNKVASHHTSLFTFLLSLGIPFWSSTQMIKPTTEGKQYHFKKPEPTTRFHIS